MYVLYSSAADSRDSLFSFNFESHELGFTRDLATVLGEFSNDRLFVFGSFLELYLDG